MVIHNGKKLKLGLALGSGGAKGAALIGALTVFEEENVKFDCVSGTSIGSVVGALYAQGYSAYDITNLIAEIGIRDPRKIVERGTYQIIRRSRVFGFEKTVLRCRYKSGYGRRG